MLRNSAHKSCIKCDKNDRHICARKLEVGILKQVTSVRGFRLFGGQ